MDRARPGRLRLLLGAALGLGLLAVILVQVDVAGTARIMAAASPSLLVVALSVVLLDLALRAHRWRVLVQGAGPEHRSSFRLALAYLTVGYLANQLLPARLGDLARAYLAGQAFGMSRLAALGTIVVERLADGGTMLALALASTFLVTGVAVVSQLAMVGLLLAVVGLAGLGLAWWVMARTPLGALRPSRFIRDVVRRVALGTGGVLTPRGAFIVAVGTVAVTVTAVSIGWLIAAATGIVLTPLQAVLFVSAMAMSLAIPAAPAAIGTYEFVGVVVLTSLGFPAEHALAAVLLMRVVTSLPPVLLGVGSVWALHLRAGQLLQPERLRGAA